MDDPTSNAAGGRWYADCDCGVPAKVRTLPPLEIADHAEALGWTEGSRVYLDWAGVHYVYPSKLALMPTGTLRVVNCVHSEAKVIEKGCQLLPNRRVPVEGEKPATAWDGGVTIQNDYLRMATDAPNGKAFVWCKSNPMETLRRMVDEYVADRERRAVRFDREHYRSTLVRAECQARYDEGFRDGKAASPRPAKSAGEVAEGCVRLYEQHRPAIDGRAFLVEIITTAVLRERAANPTIPAPDGGKSAR